MIKSRTLVNLITILVIAGAGAVGYRLWQDRTAPEEAFGEPSESPAAPPPAPESALTEPAAPPAVARPEIGEDLADLARRWEDASAGGQGAARDRKLRVLSEEAVAKLGPGDGLLAYINFLAARGAVAEREWLLREGLRSLFTGPHAKASQEWLPKLGNGRVSERIWFASGFCFEGTDFKAFLSQLPLPMAKDTALTGFCCRLGETDTENAVKVFLATRPAGVTFYPLKVIMRQAAEDSDFAKLSSQMPTDFDPKNTLAVEIRRELMKRWAEIAPERAAEYVMKTPQLVIPDQMAVVVAIWAATSPESAAEWLEQATAGPARDQGMAALARHWATRNPERAWQSVIQISGTEQRRPVADQVAMEWRRTDPAAADQAMAKLAR